MGRIVQYTGSRLERASKVIVVTELFNIAVSDINAKESSRYSRVIVVTKLVVNGSQCN